MKNPPDPSVATDPSARGRVSPVIRRGVRSPYQSAVVDRAETDPPSTHSPRVIHTRTRVTMSLRRAAEDGDVGGAKDRSRFRWRPNFIRWTRVVSQPSRIPSEVTDSRQSSSAAHHTRMRETSHLRSSSSLDKDGCELATESAQEFQHLQEQVTVGDPQTVDILRRRPSETLLNARRPVSENVFVLCDHEQPACNLESYDERLLATSEDIREESEVMTQSANDSDASHHFSTKHEELRSCGDNCVVSPKLPSKRNQHRAMESTSSTIVLPKEGSGSKVNIHHETTNLEEVEDAANNRHYLRSYRSETEDDDRSRKRTTHEKTDYSYTKSSTDRCNAAGKPLRVNRSKSPKAAQPVKRPEHASLRSTVKTRQPLYNVRSRSFHASRSPERRANVEFDVCQKHNHGGISPEKNYAPPSSLARPKKQLNSLRGSKSYPSLLTTASQRSVTPTCRDKQDNHTPRCRNIIKKYSGATHQSHINRKETSKYLTGITKHLRPASPNISPRRATGSPYGFILDKPHSSHRENIYPSIAVRREINDSTLKNQDEEYSSLYYHHREHSLSEKSLDQTDNEMTSSRVVEFVRVRRPYSPVRAAIGHFERLQRALSSPDLDMKSPPLVRALSRSTSPACVRPGVLSPDAVDFSNRSRSLECVRYPRTPSPNPFTDPMRYQHYVLRLLRASKKSPHFLRLRKYYHSLERLMELEHLVEPTKRPGTRCFPSYETWKEIRAKQRALAEMKRICDQLEQARRKREFFAYTGAKDRWHGDRSIERRQRSVEDLKQFYDDFQEREQSLTYPEKETTPHCREKVRRTLSSLSPQEIRKLKGKLSNIYGSQTSINSSCSKEETWKCGEHETDHKSQSTRFAYSRDHTPITVGSIQYEREQTSSLTRESRRSPRFGSEEREVRRDTFHLRSKSTSPVASDLSPRTCYSADICDTPDGVTDPNQFMLVLQPTTEQLPWPRSGAARGGLTMADRNSIVERSERLRDMRRARLRRPLSLISLDYATSGELCSDMPSSDSSSVQTVIERSVPRVTYQLEKSAAEASCDVERSSRRRNPTRAGSRECSPSSLAARSHSAPPASSPTSLAPPGQSRLCSNDSPAFCSEYVPEKSMSSVNLSSGKSREILPSRTYRSRTTAYKERSQSPTCRTVSFSQKTSAYDSKRSSGEIQGYHATEQNRRAVQNGRHTSPRSRHYSSSVQRRAVNLPPRQPPPYDQAVRRQNALRRLHSFHECRRSSSLPQLSRGISWHSRGLRAGAVRNLTEQFEAVGRAGPRTRSWSPPRNMRQLGAFMSRSRILSKIAELQKRFCYSSEEQEELEQLRAFLERERETLRRVRRGEVDRVKQKFQTMPSNFGGSRLQYSNESAIQHWNQKHHHVRHPKSENVLGDKNYSWKENSRNASHQRSSAPSFNSPPAPLSVYHRDSADMAVHRTSSVSPAATKVRKTLFHPVTTEYRTVRDRGAYAMAHEDYRSSSFRPQHVCVPAEVVTHQNVVDYSRSSRERSLEAGQQRSTESSNYSHQKQQYSHGRQAHQVSRTQRSSERTEHVSKVTAPGILVFARAIHAFRPISRRELGLRKGDVVIVRRRVDDNWLEGEHNSRVGIFPLNYVEVFPLEAKTT